MSSFWRRRFISYSVCAAVMVLGLFTGWGCGKPAHTLAVSQPQAGEQARGNNISVSGKTSSKAQVEVRLYQGSQILRSDILSAGEDGQFRYDFPLTKAEMSKEGAKLPLPQGDYQLEVIAKDASSREAKQTVAFSIAGERVLDQQALVAEKTRAAATAASSQGDEFLAARQYRQAIAAWESMPKEDRPQSKIDQAREAIKKAEEEQQDQARRQVAQQQEVLGDGHLAAQRYQAAIAVWESIPKQYRPQDKIDQAKKALQEKPAVSAPDPEKVMREAAQLQIAQGEELAKGGRYGEALAVWESTPEQYRPQDKIAQAKKALEGERAKLEAQARGQAAQQQEASGDARMAAQQYQEAIAIWEGMDPNYRPAGKILQARKMQAQSREAEGDKYLQEKRYGDALAVYKSIQPEYASPGLSAKIAGTELANSTPTPTSTSTPTPAPTPAPIPAPTPAPAPLPPPDTDKILKLATESAVQGKFQEAVNLFQGIPKKDPSYLAAQWNIAILSVKEDKAKNIDRAISALDFISQQDHSVYVPFYKGLAHYEKARSLEGLNDTEGAEEEYAKAVELLGEAYSKRTAFSTQKLRNVPLAPPEENILDLHYFLGVSYYFLYKYAVHDYKDPGLQNRYKLSGKDHLERYLKYSEQSAKGFQREKEVTEKLGELRGS